MFSKVNPIIRESLYGLLCQTSIGPNELSHSNGTAFMVYPGICATAAHVLHINGDKTKGLHQKIEVIRSPDLGNPMQNAHLIAEDLDRDIALIKLEHSAGIKALDLHTDRLASGTSVGSLGFPLASTKVSQTGINYHAVERFQAAYISAYEKRLISDNRVLDFYETDSLMYGGSSGCPGYTVDGKVFGIHVATRGLGEKQAAQRIAISLWVPSTDVINLLQSSVNQNI